MKNLVKPHLFLWQRINLSHAKDIFNDASEMLEKIEGFDNSVDINLLLSFLGIFVVNSATMDKPDNNTVSLFLLIYLSKKTSKY